MAGCKGNPVLSPNKTREPSKTVISKPKFTKDTYPKVDGSTATIPLSEAIACELLGMSKEEVTKFIRHNTTHTAYENLINKKADIIFVTEPSLEELKMAKDANIELEVVPVVREGFVFLVNSQNPVKSLTVQQIQDIYQGKIKNWKEVGGKDEEIIAYQREANSGSQTLMEQLVMKDKKLGEPEKKLVVQGMGALIESVAKYDNSEKAIGYSVYYYAKTMYSRDTIKLISIDNVAPDNKSISSLKYPFVSGYFAVMRKSEAADSPARRLLEWILSKKGQNLVEKAGYVPM